MLITRPSAMRIRRPGFPAAAGREFSALCAEINEGVSVAKRPLSAAKGKNASAFFRLMLIAGRQKPGYGGRLFISGENNAAPHN
ncbi:MAG: hypothetical protein A2270_04420 [Elusimicrobia bacterium RIFOXYA12_FULL_51_18]|nr:MAG: hypothetical protein A2270_04420 [Elusimicrobia bacterium RIFOXYA12_FULL_51_18]OGS30041.1 MAG: hypothetical protein A2218_12905 [Elusimicrobia bacterium RIFOXYA2_FULL_53_38]